jgi:colicin import membrane protein
MSYAIPQDEPGGAASAMLSVIVHGLLLVFLFAGLHWQSKHPDTVEVELWNELPPIEQAQPPVEPKAEVKPEPPEPKAQKPDIAVAREKKAPRKPRPLKFDTTQRIREQLAEEQRTLRQTREQQEALKQFTPAAAPSADTGYIDKIRSKIKGNIVLPPDIKGNPEAIFDVVQLPTGEVLSARLKISSGHKPYDEAVERAILKSSPLPRAERPDQFRRELQLKFRPQE